MFKEKLLNLQGTREEISEVEEIQNAVKVERNCSHKVQGQYFVIEKCMHERQMKISIYLWWIPNTFACRKICIHMLSCSRLYYFYPFNPENKF